jgi:hypothetical protein
MKKLAGLRAHSLAFMLVLVSARVGIAEAQTTTNAYAKVIRFQDQVEFFVVDKEHGLLSLHGLGQSFSQLCSGVPFTVDDLDIQLVDSPTSALHLLFTGAEHTVWIYPAPQLPDPNHFGPEDCPILAGLPVLATGKARVVRTDNDVTLDGPGADAFGWTAEGALTGPSGEPLRYGETVRLEVPPSNATLRELKVDVRLVPVAPR